MVTILKMVNKAFNFYYWDHSGKICRAVCATHTRKSTRLVKQFILFFVLLILFRSYAYIINTFYLLPERIRIEIRGSHFWKLSFSTYSFCKGHVLSFQSYSILLLYIELFYLRRSQKMWLLMIIPTFSIKVYSYRLKITHNI